jgi:hypothetical protein
VFLTAQYDEHIDQAGLNQLFQAYSVFPAAEKLGTIPNQAHFAIVFGFILSFCSTGLV